MFTSTRLYTTVAVLVTTLAPVLARAQDLRINLCREDQYARRTMQIVKKSGETTSNVLRIRSYTAGSNSFVIERVTGETTSVAASEIEEIHFKQEPQNQQSVAQMAVPLVKARSGDSFLYRLSEKSLTIDDSGDLILPESASREKLPKSEPVNVETSGDKTRILASATIAEARRLTYDPAKKSFVLEIQYVKYTKEMSGSGKSTPSGIAK